MKSYLDSLDSFYSIDHEPDPKLKPKQNKDYAGIGAIIFTFTVLSIVFGLSIYTAWNIAYGSEYKDKDKVENFYFSVNILDWTYAQYSDTPQSRSLGYGPVNEIKLAPSEFSEVLSDEYSDKGKTVDDWVLGYILQDNNYNIKNSPVESYVKHIIDFFGITNITSQHYTTIDKEKSVRISANESLKYGPANIVLYVVMHNKEPYQLLYLEHPKHDKYLADFEKIVKSFKFVDGLFSNTESDNETETNTNTNKPNETTNFLPSNLKDTNTLTAGSNSSTRPYVGIIGLSLTADMSKQLGLNQTKGFLVTSITKGSPAEKADLHAGTTTKTYNGRDYDVGGDIILKMDNKEVSNISDITSYVSQKRIGDKVNLTISRDNGIREIDLVLEELPIQPPQNGNGNSPEELFDECVRVAGKSFCDFLFRK